MRSLCISLAFILLVPLARAQAIAPDVLMRTVEGMIGALASKNREAMKRAPLRT